MFYSMDILRTEAKKTASQTLRDCSEDITVELG